MAPEALCFQFLWGWAERGRRQGCSRYCHTWLSLNNFGQIFSACLFLSADRNGLLINPTQAIENDSLVELMQEALPFCFSLPEEGQALAARMLPFLGIEQYEQMLDISHINVCKAYHKVQELISLGFSHFFFTFSLQKFYCFAFFAF